MAQLPPNLIPGVATAGDREAAVGRYYVGRPDGPEIFHEIMGLTVGTFTDPRDDLRLAKSSLNGTLMHHVPPNKRGYYRPHQMANYDPMHLPAVDQHDYVMCTDVTRMGSPCQRRAVNYSMRCQAHGGSLHPLDKVVDERRPVLAEAKPDGPVPEHLTRWNQLISGIITVEDLDDEELARGQCRDANGGFSGRPPSTVPAKLLQEMKNRLFSRVDDVFKADLIETARTFTRIATSDAYEPADQLQAGKFVIERVMGKNPDVVVHTAAAPWEEIMQDIQGGSRAASRARRGVATPDELLQLEAMKDAEIPIVIEAEYVEEAGEAAEPGVAEAGISVHDPASVNNPVDQAYVFPPPVHPLARHEYEKQMAQHRVDDAKPPELTREERRQLVKKARARRYAARAAGQVSLRDLPFAIEFRKVANKMLWRVLITLPEDTRVPISVKASETRRRNRARRE